MEEIAAEPHQATTAASPNVSPTEFFPGGRGDGQNSDIGSDELGPPFPRHLTTEEEVPIRNMGIGVECIIKEYKLLKT